jgi:small subunit ribosomal protein S8
MVTDSIADLLTRIRNAQKAKNETTSCRYSKIKHGICEILQKHGFISKVEVTSEDKKELIITLNYARPTVTLKRISKPGQRIYKKYTEFKPVKSGLGIEIISTSKGLMPQYEAYKSQLGGEVICQIY